MTAALPPQPERPVKLARMSVTKGRTISLLLPRSLLPPTPTPASRRQGSQNIVARCDSNAALCNVSAAVVTCDRTVRVTVCGSPFPVKFNDVDPKVHPVFCGRLLQLSVTVPVNLPVGETVMEVEAEPPLFSVKAKLVCPPSVRVNGSATTSISEAVEVASLPFVW